MSPERQRALLRQAMQRLNEDFRRMSSGAAWIKHLQIEKLGNSLWTDKSATPDMRTRTTLVAIADRFDTLATYPKFKTIYELWGAQVMRAALREYAMAPIERAKRPVRDALNILRRALERIRHGKRWQTFLRVDDVASIAKSSARLSSSNRDVLADAIKQFREVKGNSDYRSIAQLTGFEATLRSLEELAKSTTRAQIIVMPPEAKGSKLAIVMSPVDSDPHAVMIMPLAEGEAAVVMALEETDGKMAIVMSPEGSKVVAARVMPPADGRTAVAMSLRKTRGRTVIVMSPVESFANEPMVMPPSVGRTALVLSLLEINGKTTMVMSPYGSDEVTAIVMSPSDEETAIVMSLRGIDDKMSIVMSPSDSDAAIMVMPLEPEVMRLESPKVVVMSPGPVVMSPESPKVVVMSPGPVVMSPSRNAHAEELLNELARDLDALKKACKEENEANIALAKAANGSPEYDKAEKLLETAKKNHAKAMTKAKKSLDKLRRFLSPTSSASSEPATVLPPK